MQHSSQPKAKALLGRLGDIDLRLLRVFKAVADCGGMAAAVPRREQRVGSHGSSASSGDEMVSVNEFSACNTGLLKRSSAVWVGLDKTWTCKLLLFA